VLPQSYIVDSEVGVKNPVGMFGKRLEANFHVVIGQVTSMNNIRKCVNRVGLEVNNLILEPLASSYAVLTEDEKEAGVALVDIGGGTTDIAVYYDKIIRHTAVIPFGGNAITNDIKEYCSILEREAELLKIKFGSALAEVMKENEVVTIPGISGREPKEVSLKSLANVIQARMEEIIEAVNFQLDHSGFSKKLGAGIVITGGGSLLKNLTQYFAYKTGHDIRLGYPVEHLASEVSEDVNQPVYSTGIGLLLMGYDEQKANMEKNVTNSKPQDMQKRAEKLQAAENEKKSEAQKEQTDEKEENRERTGWLKTVVQSFSKVFDNTDTQL
jgi:cell division protein FtsA